MNFANILADCIDIESRTNGGESLNGDTKDKKAAESVTTTAATTTTEETSAKMTPTGGENTADDKEETPANAAKEKTNIASMGAANIVSDAETTALKKQVNSLEIALSGAIAEKKKGEDKLHVQIHDLNDKIKTLKDRLKTAHAVVAGMVRNGGNQHERGANFNNSGCFSSNKKKRPRGTRAGCQKKFKKARKEQNFQP